MTRFFCSRLGSSAIGKNATHQAVAHQITSPPLSLEKTGLEGDEGKVFLSCAPYLLYGGGERRGALGTAKLVLLQEQHRCRRLRSWQPAPLHSRANRRWRELPEQQSSHNPAQQPRHFQRGTEELCYKRRTPTTAHPQQGMGDAAVSGPRATRDPVPRPASQMAVGEKLRGGQPVD